MRRGLAAILVLIPGLAFAGGKEYPDNGAEGLARGGAFTAKADDLTAMQYNLGGLGFQRGTRILLDANLVFAAADFTRAGTYPANGYPYDNQPFPKVSNQASPRLAPMILVASDFGLSWLTAGAGVFGPSSYGKFQFADTVNVNGTQAPGPQRYDIGFEDITVGYATFALAVKPLPWLSIGGAFHSVFAAFQFKGPTYLPLCSGQEDPGCDVQANIDVSQTFSPSYSFGALAKLPAGWQVGVNWRAPTDIEMKGPLTLTSGPKIPMGLVGYKNGADHATMDFTAGTPALPWMLRGGVRRAFGTDGFERGDVELDAVYEAWGSVSRDFKLVTTGLTLDNTFLSPERYDDTVSVRAGGAYNIDLQNDQMVTLRLGGYYDTAASKSTYTRLDFLALDHIGLTLGAGYHWKGLKADLGFAYVIMPQRTVSDSDLRPINGLGSGVSLPPVGNGVYSGSYSIVMVGLQYTFGGR